MKKSFLVILVIILGQALIAQPTDAKVKADLKAKFPSATNIILRSNGTTGKEWENNEYISVYRRDVSIELPSTNKNYPKVKVMLYGGVRYNVNGTNHTFSKYNPGSEEIIGMPKPNKEELLKFLDDQVLEIFRLAERNEIIGLPSAFEINENTKYSWPSFDRLEFDTWVTYEKLINDIGDAKTIKEAIKIRMYRDENGSWNRIDKGTASIENNKIILSEKKYSAVERAKLKTFEMLLQSKLAEKKINAMQPIDLPAMKDNYEVMNFVHSQFLSADKAKIESMLYQLLASFYFSKTDKNVPTRDGQELIDKILKNTVSGDFIYKNQYCEKPEIKENGNGSIDYWNKDKTAYTRLELGTENNNWKLGGITIYIISTLEKAQKTEATACGNGNLTTVQRGEKNANQKITKNDWVLAYYDSDGYWYPSFYLGYANNYYDIQYFQGNAKSKVRKVIPFMPEVGDKAFVKLQNGQITEVIIKSIKGTDIVIDFNGTDTNYKLSGVMFR
ncbi:hypothetical protein M0M57_16495 [Flavobacterium azooxidireducens]|uniref:DUF4412 domain-containing protein n=1 Tax=Flavobacterium azooxidireducens TaxID=1871076 RepID=A0ABY4KEH1_9FLAO|nr:hypothetical protein [Flavobacterium azooxidireducens]UPQ79202.1 hypothetical protein M0M57_16495 [Flavobacterium azooxidireducens]